MGLCLDIIPTSCCTTLKISDGSVFTTEVVTDLTVSVTIPGIEAPVLFEEYSSNFIENISSVDLGLSTEIESLPDGVYVLVLSANVDGTVVSYEKKHLRVCTTLYCYYEELCKLKYDCGTCGTKQKADDLFHIKMYIDGAIAKVEYCGAEDEGVAMLNYAKKLLSKYQTGSCLTC